MKLIIHVGAGKTGTSSIQHALGNHTQELQENGIFYAGMYFERSPFYQSKGILPHIQFYRENSQGNGVVSKHVHEQLDQLIPYCEERNIHTIIWSHESLFSSYDKLGTLFEELKEKVDIQLIAYLRRQDSWLSSAYQQWGIEHKTNPGHTLSFNEWYKTWKVQCDYNNIFTQWASFVGEENIVLRIYENTDDVVSDFYKTCSLGIDIPVRKSVQNKSVNNTHASLFKLYNTHFKDQKPPHALGVFLKRTGIAKLSLDHIDASLNFPSTARLAELQQEYAESNEQLKRFSHQGSTQDLEFPQEPMEQNDSISRDGLISALLTALVHCETRICKLEDTLRAQNS